MSYIFEQIKVGNNTNCYIFGDTNTKEIVIIDPGFESDKIFDVVNKNNYIVKYILLTHGHYDHIGAVKDLKELTKAKILIHELDGEMLVSPQKNLSVYVGKQEVKQPKADIFLKDRDVIKIGDLSFDIIHTPGHTPGGICVLFQDILFSGDTLFKGTIGRTDLPFSDYSDIINSINSLMKLNDNTKVYPGHGKNTSISHEKISNPFIKKK